MRKILSGIGGVATGFLCVFGWVIFAIGYNGDRFMGKDVGFGGSMGLMIGGLILGISMLLASFTLLSLFFSGIHISDNHGEF